MESESLPLIGSARSYGGLSLPQTGARSKPIDDAALERVERRLAKFLRGSGAVILHDLAVPATGTVIDHLCIAPAGITAIDVERESDGYGRDELISRARREAQVIAAALTDALVVPNQVAAAICRATRPEPLRSASLFGVEIGGPRTVAKFARTRRPGEPIDVQLALAAARSHLGYEHQRGHRLSRPDGFAVYSG